MNINLSLKRIQKQIQNIQIEPIINAIIARETSHLFHFCLYGLQQPYTHGFYHGILELANDYPFSPPQIIMITNNGRFQSNKSICTTFTHFHKQTWSASWNIRSMIMAFVSFMHEEEKGLGGLVGNKIQMAPKRKLLAERSLKQNLRNDKFVELFKQKLIQLKLVTQEKINQLKTTTATSTCKINMNNQLNQIENNNIDDMKQTKIKTINFNNDQNHNLQQSMTAPRQKLSKKTRGERQQLNKTEQDSMQMKDLNVVEQGEMNQAVEEQETGQYKRQMFRDQEQINQYQIMAKKKKQKINYPISIQYQKDKTPSRKQIRLDFNQNIIKHHPTIPTSILQCQHPSYNANIHLTYQHPSYIPTSTNYFTSLSPAFPNYIHTPQIKG